MVDEILKHHFITNQLVYVALLYSWLSIGHDYVWSHQSATITSHIDSTVCVVDKNADEFIDFALASQHTEVVGKFGIVEVHTNG